MRTILTSLICLIVSPLSAEVIGNVEYHLPNQGQDWKIATELQGSKNGDSTTIVYIPEKESKQNAKEFFAVHTNDLPTNLLDKESLEKALEKAQFKFLDAKVQVKPIVIAGPSAFYEYTINQGNQEKARGWLRVLSSPEKTVMLTYQTEQIDKIDQVRPTWMHILQSAKPVK